MTITKKMSMIDKLNDVQKERLLQGINNLKDITNDISDACPLDYNKVIDLPILEYFLAELFDLELPKYENTYANRYRPYTIKKSSGNG